MADISILSGALQTMQRRASEIQNDHLALQTKLLQLQSQAPLGFQLESQPGGPLGVPSFQFKNVGAADPRIQAKVQQEQAARAQEFEFRRQIAEQEFAFRRQSDTASLEARNAQLREQRQFERQLADESGLMQQLAALESSIPGLGPETRAAQLRSKRNLIASLGVTAGRLPQDSTAFQHYAAVAREAGIPGFEPLGPEEDGAQQGPTPPLAAPGTSPAATPQSAPQAQAPTPIGALRGQAPDRAGQLDKAIEQKLASAVNTDELRAAAASAGVSIQRFAEQTGLISPQEVERERALIDRSIKEGEEGIRDAFSRGVAEGTTLQLEAERAASDLNIKNPLVQRTVETDDGPATVLDVDVDFTEPRQIHALVQAIDKVAANAEGATDEEKRLIMEGSISQIRGKLRAGLDQAVDRFGGRVDVENAGTPRERRVLRLRAPIIDVDGEQTVLPSNPGVFNSITSNVAGATGALIGLATGSKDRARRLSARGAARNAGGTFTKDDIRALGTLFDRVVNPLDAIVVEDPSVNVKTTAGLTRRESKKNVIAIRLR